jgi:hypothetical protein
LNPTKPHFFSQIQNRIPDRIISHAQDGAWKSLISFMELQAFRGKNESPRGVLRGMYIPRKRDKKAEAENLPRCRFSY